MYEERYGNFAEGLSWDEINRRIGELNEQIAEMERKENSLKDSLAEGLITHEDYTLFHDPLDQELTVAKYNRDAYLSRLE